MSIVGPPVISASRWVVCALLFFATTINYMDRQVLGLLAPVLEKEIGWSEKEYANIVIAFQAAYALGLLGCGRWIDRIGTRHGYALAVGGWSAAAMAHALATSVFGFGVARAALGLGEAGNFPAAVKTVAENFPPQERALATGIFNSGANVGAILAPLAVPWLTTHYGWQTAFIALGATGFVWVGLWYLFPAQPVATSADTTNRLPTDDSRPLSWGKLLTYRQTWAFIVGIALTAPIWWFYLYWLPKFFHKKYGLDLEHLGRPLIIIYSMTCIGSMAGGWLSSYLLGRGWSLNASRKTAMLVCALSVLPVLFAANVSNLWVASLLIGLAAAAHQGWAANLFTLVSDMFPQKSVASVVGLGSMFGSLTAMGFAQVTGWILETTGSYWTLFFLAGTAYLTALGLMQILLPQMMTVKEPAI